MRLSTPWCWIEHQEIVIHLFVDLHYSCLVTAAITVVWCGEYCDNLLLVAPIVSLYYIEMLQFVKPDWCIGMQLCLLEIIVLRTYCHDKLMCSGYRLKAIFLYKLI